MGITELEALQNASTPIGLTAHERFNSDKRLKIKKYFLTLNGRSVSPVMNYENLNHFILGWTKSLENNQTTKKSQK